MHDHAQNLVIKSLPPSRERLPLFIVGDVHGCARELAELLKKAKDKVSRFQLVLVGDLFTKGPDPVGVFRIIQENEALCIKGNHDWALWASLIQASRKGTQSMPEHTQQTLYLVRHHKRAIFDLLVGLPHAYTSSVNPLVKRKGWEAEYPLTIVHAGIDCTKGLAQTAERMLLTARYVRWDNDPAKEGERRLVLVPSGYRAEAMASAPPSVATRVVNQQDLLRQTERFRWHELHQGPELIVFGHDAKQGLFRKTLPTGRPICVGTDTGCTYGRSLTGYFPEFDDAIQVPSRRTYFDIQRNVILIKAPNPKVAV